MNLLCGHSEPYSQTWPASGSMRSGRASALRRSALPTSGSGSSSSRGLPTPRARDGRGRGYEDGLPNVVQLLPTPTVSEATGIGHAAQGGMNLRHTVSLLPTPTSTPYGNNQSPSPGAAVRPSLDSLAPTLLPTPRASANENRQTKRTPSQEAGTHGLCLAAEMASLLPTPRATDGTKGGPNQRGSKGDLTLPSAAHRIGDRTGPPSPAGSASSDGPLPGQLTLPDA